MTNAGFSAIEQYRDLESLNHVNDALSRQLQHDHLSGLLADLVQQHGPIDPKVMDEVRQEWHAPKEKTAT